MAESAAHKWGQIIGDLLQHSLREELQKVADRHQLYLDYQRDRPARKGSRVSWQDRYGNGHDLDYVLERGGTETTIGEPAAFIEVAWRRYTKHSKNKAQEIQGAVLALAETYHHFHPFLGIILAGEFTRNAVAQLRSHAFSVFHISYADIMRAFASVAIDAHFDERTPERRFREKIKHYRALTPPELAKFKEALLTSPQPGSAPLKEFLATLEASLSRRIVGITVLVLHGQPQQMPSAAEAIQYLESYQEVSSMLRGSDQIRGRVTLQQWRCDPRHISDQGSGDSLSSSSNRMTGPPLVIQLHAELHERAGQKTADAKLQARVVKLLEARLV